MSQGDRQQEGRTREQRKNLAVNLTIVGYEIDKRH